MHGERVAQVGGGRLQQITPAHHPGDVDHEVEPPELLHRGVDELAHLGLVGDVGLRRVGAAALRPDQLGDLLGHGLGEVAAGQVDAPVGDYDGRVPLAERQREGPADSRPPPVTSADLHEPTGAANPAGRRAAARGARSRSRRQPMAVEDGVGEHPRRHAIPDLVQARRSHLGRPPAPGTAGCPGSGGSPARPRRPRARTAPRTRRGPRCAPRRSGSARRCGGSRRRPRAGRIRMPNPSAVMSHWPATCGYGVTMSTEYPSAFSSSASPGAHEVPSQSYTTTYVPAAAAGPRPSAARA